MNQGQRRKPWLLAAVAAVTFLLLALLVGPWLRMRLTARGAELEPSHGTGRAWPEMGPARETAAEGVRTVRAIGARILAVHEAGAGRAVQAMVHCYRWDGTWHSTYVTDMTGEVEIREQEPILIGVQAAGFFPRVGSLDFGREPRAIIELTAMSTLQLCFLDEERAPVVGIAVLIEEADSYGTGPSTRSMAGPEWAEILAGQALDFRTLLALRTELETRGRRFQLGGDAVLLSRAADWGVMRASDDAGFVAWPLPARTAVRWRLLEPLPVAMEPPYEIPAVQPAGERFLVSRVPAGVSGSLALEPGEVRCIEISVYRQTGVQGRLSLLGREFEEAGIHLFREEEFPHPKTGKIFAQTIEEASIRPEPDGSFDLRGITPGTKLLTSWWLDRERTLRFAEVRFSLARGERKQLGWIENSAGSEQEYRVVFQDPSGETVPSEQLFGATPVVAWLHASRQFDRAEPQNRFSFMIPVQVGVSYRLAGIPAGRYSSTARLCDEIPALDAAWRVMTDVQTVRDVSLLVPSGQRVDFPIPVAQVVEVQLRLVAELPAPAQVRVHGKLVDLDTGMAYEFRARPDEGHPEMLAAMLRVPAGRYRLFAAFVRLEPEVEPPNLFADEAFDVGPAPVRRQVQLRPGAELHLVVRDRAGTPQADAALFLHPEQHWRGQRGPAPWLLYGRTSAEGECRIRGVPPHSRWTCPPLETPISAGAAGSVTEVALVIE